MVAHPVQDEPQALILPTERGDFLGEFCEALAGLIHRVRRVGGETRRGQCRELPVRTQAHVDVVLFGADAGDDAP